MRAISMEKNVLLQSIINEISQLEANVAYREDHSFFSVAPNTPEVIHACSKFQKTIRFQQLL